MGEGTAEGLALPPPRFRILGALEAHAGARPLLLGPPKQRIVLGMLLCRPNRVVPADVLCEALWAGSPPRTAPKHLQMYVSALRKALRGEPGPGAVGGPGGGPGAQSPADHVLLRRGPGYLIHVGPGQLDLLEFEELARGGRLAMRGGDTAEAARLLGAAVAMRRGPVLSDLVRVPALAAAVQRLEDRCLTVYEDWCQAESALGRLARHLDGINELARRHPYRERLRHAQLLALCRSGRQDEALALFEVMRQGLARDRGTRPGPLLGRLHEAMLRGDAGLVPSPAVRPEAAALPTDGGRLPRDDADFTGRAAQVEELAAALGGAGAHRGTVICGLAGVGKTALAVHCAHRAADRFPDGRVLVALHFAEGGPPRPTADVLAELLRGAGVSGPLPAAPDERAALYRTLLADRKMLVILDGARDDAQVRPLLPGVGESRVLITSRRRLAGLDAVGHLGLAPMDESEGVGLLARLAGPHRVAAEPAAARRLAAVCGLLPLPLRIVGANLAGLPHLTLGHYARRLADEGRLLDQLAAGELRIRPLLDNAYTDLHPDDRATLRRIGQLAEGAFSLHEAAQALGAGPARAEKAVERLVAAHLVVRHPPGGHPPGGHPPGGGYLLPYPVRAYARERAAEEARTGSGPAGSRSTGSGSADPGPAGRSAELACAVAAFTPRASVACPLPYAESAGRVATAR